MSPGHGLGSVLCVALRVLTLISDWCFGDRKAVLKVVWKSRGLPFTTYPFPLSPPSVYHPTPLSWGAELRAGG